MNCMETPPPDSLLGKRATPDDNTDELDVAGDDNRTTSGHSVDRNMLLFACKYAARKKLKPEAAKDIERFMMNPHALELFKIYTLGLELMAGFSSIRAAAPEFRVLDDLQTNIKTVVYAVLLTPRLSLYRDDVPANIICFHLGPR
ncbi:hypothetical protein BC835DRAFT_1424516 [Cytidiella melzeri]|nr:hypothetical protein BC835DRAFT_1424516 [Cytidiella melzeri]